MEVLTLNGQKYVKASKAARDLGYASDYVGQLCRKGTVDAHLVGRTWYVNPETLGAHRVEKKRNARVKAREYARKTLEETRSLKVSDDTNSYKNIGIRYEGDDRSLIPEVKKVEVDSYRERVVREAETKETYTIENKDQKIIMSGKVPVQDAELEGEFTDTVVLSPKIVHHSSPKEATKSKSRKLTPRTPVDIAVETSTEEKAVTFADRLASFEATSPTEATRTEDVPMMTDTAAGSSSQKSSLWGIGSLVIALLGVATLFIEAHHTYSAGFLETSYAFESQKVYDFMAQNIEISSRLFK